MKGEMKREERWWKKKNIGPNICQAKYSVKRRERWRNEKKKTLVQTYVKPNTVLSQILFTDWGGGCLWKFTDLHTYLHIYVHTYIRKL